MKNVAGVFIYQIYPRSYYDSNNDGIGDLPGITEKLDYIKDLGADYVWISPFFTSPMKDFGYDVSDYKNVDPIFGKLDDFKKLVAKANQLGLKVMIDMVLSHTSDQHPWFIESRGSKKNPRADWYVWADGKKDTLPNNWLSVFGGSSWQWDDKREQYYLHNFLKEQPDLNFHTEEVQDALLGACDFWFKLGVKGFRLDTVNFYYHDAQLRNNPVLQSKPKALDAPDFNPYVMQKHLYDKTQPENITFLKKLRKLADTYDAILLGEVGANQETTRVISEYTNGDELLQLCYGFNYIGGPFTARYYAHEINTFWKKAPESMICNAFGNHDSARWASRFKHDKNHTPEFKRLVFAVLGSLRGAFCVYQGEELGLTEYDIKFEELQDPYGKNFFPKFKGRDGCRTPMVWDGNKICGGFNQGAKPWLPVAIEHLALAPKQQLENPNSLLHWVRDFMAFRKKHILFSEGVIEAETVGSGVLHIIRRPKVATPNLKPIHGYFNFQAKNKALPIKPKDVGYSQNYDSKTNRLSAYGFVIYW